MENDESERLLTEIGQLLSEDTEFPLDGTLLYAQVDQNFVAPSIFKEQGNYILFRWPDLNRIGEALLDLWEAQEPDDRWSEIEYLIRNDKFDVIYTYPDEVDPEEDTFERRNRVVERHFGEKPIVYPPMPLDDELPQYEL